MESNKNNVKLDNSSMTAQTCCQWQRCVEKLLQQNHQICKWNVGPSW